MQKIIIALACLACMAHGRRVQPAENTQSGVLQGGAFTEDKKPSVPFRTPPISVSRIEAEVKLPNGQGSEDFDSYRHIALNSTYSNFKEQAFTFPKRKPWEFAAILATLKTWMADVLIQIIQRPPRASWSFDWRRSAAFAAFGFIYLGIVQWFLYIEVLTWLFPNAITFANEPWSLKLVDVAGQKDIVGQVLMNNFVFNALVYFPVFYVFKAIFQEGNSLPSRIYSGLKKYRTTFVVDNMASCSIWIPANVIMFASPMHLRCPLGIGVAFGWTMFISFLRGAINGPETRYLK